MCPLPSRANLMSRKTILLAAGIALGVLLVVGAVLAVLVKHEPRFYGRASLSPGPARVLSAQTFALDVNNLRETLKVHTPRWWATFTEAQINSFFQEALAPGTTKTEFSFLDFFLTEASSPCVSIEADRIRLAFRYGEEPWSSVISIDVRAWLAKNEPNVVCLELQGLHAGALPLSTQSILDRITGACQRNHIGVKWYRRNGNPVALLHFQSDGPRPSVQLSKLELRQGMLVISGTCINPGAVMPTAN
jgi:hypothetical protein